MTTLRIRGACPHDCPDTCGVITEVEAGRAVSFRGDPDNSVTRGWLCAKVRPYLEHVYHPGRLLYPLKRTGPKGSGQWQRIPWAEALEEITSRWKAIIASHGGEAILPYSYSGTLGLVQMVVASGRFWNRLGASQLQRSICGAAAEKAVEATLGARWSPDYAEVVHSKLVICWGHNPVSTAPHFMPFLAQARKQGCRLIVIDPHRTKTAELADRHVAPLPGSDGALALGLAHVLVMESRHDEDWLERYTVGWPQLRQRLAEFSPERVAALTGLPGNEIIDLARSYASVRPSLIKIADGTNRNRNGGQNVRAICALPAITGQYGVRGGGLAYSTSGYVKWDAEAVHHWRNCPRPGRVVNMNRLGAALTGEIRDPPIRSLFVFGANPATSTPNAGRIVEGLKRDDLFTVVHDLFMTDTAEYADIVLPATSQLEQVDLHKAYGHPQLTYNHAAIAPLGECRSNWDMIQDLATAMGFDEPWLHQSPDQVIDEVLTAMRRDYPAFAGVTLAKLKAGGAIRLAVPTTPFSDCRFLTPSGKVELFSQTLADQGLEPLPGRFLAAEDASAGADALTLITGAAHHFVSSSLAGQPSLLAGAGTPFVEIHPADAQSRGIAHGDQVILENSRGFCQLRAVVSDAVRPGVLISPKGRWARLSGGRNANWLTTDQLGDFAGQSTYHDSRVRIRKA